MITAVHEGERVVRLKGGDPFIFGRGGEEVEHLEEAGIRVSVINGITAGADTTARSYAAISDAGDLYIGGGQYALEAPLCVSRVLIANRGLSDANLQNAFGA